jgi:predicted nucleic acid-binding protein
MIVVANSSPLIGLARVNLLQILGSLYKQVFVSEEIFCEVTERGRGKPGEREIRKATWINVMSVKNRELVKRYADTLSAADATVIALAKEMKADLVIIDDKELRRSAKRERIPATGTIGVLLQGKEEGVISSVREALDGLIREEFRVSEEMYKYALRKADE